MKDILNLVPDIEIISYNEEEGYINGSKTPCKVEYMERNLDKMDENGKKLYHLFKTFFENNNINVDKVVKNGDVISKGEDMQVIATPGHTPGHMCLYIERYKLLIAGDLLCLKDGNITLCPKELNYNNDMYLQSVNKIRDLELEMIICFHGGLVYIS